MSRTRAARWAAWVAVGGLTACQGSIIGEGPGSAGPLGAAAGGSSAGGASATAPAFQPLGGPEPIVCAPQARSFGGRRIWRLTRQQYDQTAHALLGDATQPAQKFNPEPGSEQGFQNDAFALRVRGAEAAQLQAAAQGLAERAVSSGLGRLAACAVTSLADAACQNALIDDFGKRAFRRPLAGSEHARYLELFQLGTSKRDASLGAQVVVEAMLQSPHFLYRFELGGAPSDAVVRLTDHELASLLSYTFTGAPPDAELTALADGATLVPALDAQARRLLQKPEARPAVAELFRQLFELTTLADAPKDEAVFPDFEAKRSDLAASAQVLTEHLLFDGDATLESLLTSNVAFVNQNLAPLFGVTSTSNALELVSLGLGERQGLLTHPAVMAVLAARTRTSPVNRGRFVREKLLCHHISDPPPNVDTSLPVLDPGLTARQQLDQKTSGDACIGCHALMNPVGFGFEQLDGIGRMRSDDNGVAIDASGALSDTRDIDGPFLGAAELSSKLASSAQVQECLAVQAFRYAFGRPESYGDACAIAEVRDRLVSSGGNLRELYLAIAATDSFRTRKAD